MRAAAVAAVDAIRSRTALKPEVAIVLGSGLGGIANEVAEAIRIPYSEIPGWERSTAPGHVGELVVGKLADKVVAVMKGRLHYYEGYSVSSVAFPVRVLNTWGIDTIILTNACGGLNPSFRAGDLMLIADHIYLLPDNPLRGPNDESFGPRFPDLLGTYTAELREVAKSVDPDLREGVYVAVPGPNFETPAELRMLRALGADAVGMSTLPEVLVARHAGMRVLAISTVTDMALGDRPEHVSEASILAVANQAAGRVSALVKGIVSNLSST